MYFGIRLEKKPANCLKGAIKGRFFGPLISKENCGMKALLVAIFSITVIIPNSSFAACFGTTSYYSCYDSSGNSYSVNKSGGNTYMNGYNSQTGSSWNQNTYRYGNTSNTYGTDSRGNSWHSYTTPYGTQGTDSRGRSFYVPNRRY